ELIGLYKQELEAAQKFDLEMKPGVVKKLEEKGLMRIADRLRRAYVSRAPPEFVELFQAMTIRKDLPKGRVLRGFNFTDEQGNTRIFIADDSEAALAHEAGAISGLPHDKNQTLEEIITDKIEDTGEEEGLCQGLNLQLDTLGPNPEITDRASTAEGYLRIPYGIIRLGTQSVQIGQVKYYSAFIRDIDSIDNLNPAHPVSRKIAALLRGEQVTIKGLDTIQGIAGSRVYELKIEHEGFNSRAYFLFDWKNSTLEFICWALTKDIKGGDGTAKNFNTLTLAPRIKARRISDDYSDIERIEKELGILVKEDPITNELVQEIINTHPMKLMAIFDYAFFNKVQDQDLETGSLQDIATIASSLYGREIIIAQTPLIIIVRELAEALRVRQDADINVSVDRMLKGRKIDGAKRAKLVSFMREWGEKWIGARVRIRRFIEKEFEKEEPHFESLNIVYRAFPEMMINIQEGMEAWAQGVDPEILSLAYALMQDNDSSFRSTTIDNFIHKPDQTGDAPVSPIKVSEILAAGFSILVAAFFISVAIPLIGKFIAPLVALISAFYFGTAYYIHASGVKANRAPPLTDEEKDTLTKDINRKYGIEIGKHDGRKDIAYVGKDKVIYVDVQRFQYLPAFIQDSIIIHEKAHQQGGSELDAYFAQLMHLFSNPKAIVIIVGQLALAVIAAKFLPFFMRYILFGVGTAGLLWMVTAALFLGMLALAVKSIANLLHGKPVTFNYSLKARLGEKYELPQPEKLLALKQVFEATYRPEHYGLANAVKDLFSKATWIMAAVGAFIGILAFPTSLGQFALYAIKGAVFGLAVKLLVSAAWWFFFDYLWKNMAFVDFVAAYAKGKNKYQQDIEKLAGTLVNKGKSASGRRNIWLTQKTLQHPVAVGVIRFALQRVLMVVLASMITPAIMSGLGLNVAASVDFLGILGKLALPHKVSDLLHTWIVVYLFKVFDLVRIYKLLAGEKPGTARSALAVLATPAFILALPIVALLYGFVRLAAILNVQSRFLASIFKKYRSLEPILLEGNWFAQSYLYMYTVSAEIHWVLAGSNYLASHPLLKFVGEPLSAAANACENPDYGVISLGQVAWQGTARALDMASKAIFGVAQAQELPQGQQPQASPQGSYKILGPDGRVVEVLTLEGNPVRLDSVELKGVPQNLESLVNREWQARIKVGNYIEINRLRTLDAALHKYFAGVGYGYKYNQESAILMIEAQGQPSDLALSADVSANNVFGGSLRYLRTFGANAFEASGRLSNKDKTFSLDGHNYSLIWPGQVGVTLGAKSLSLPENHNLGILGAKLSGGRPLGDIDGRLGLSGNVGYDRLTYASVGFNNPSLGVNLTYNPSAIAQYPPQGPYLAISPEVGCVDRDNYLRSEAMGAFGFTAVKDRFGAVAYGAAGLLMQNRLPSPLKHFLIGGDYRNEMIVPLRGYNTFAEAGTGYWKLGAEAWVRVSGPLYIPLYIEGAQLSGMSEVKPSVGTGLIYNSVPYLGVPVRLDAAYGLGTAGRFGVSLRLGNVFSPCNAAGSFVASAVMFVVAAVLAIFAGTIGKILAIPLAIFGSFFLRQALAILFATGSFSKPIAWVEDGQIKKDDALFSFLPGYIQNSILKYHEPVHFKHQGVFGEILAYANQILGLLKHPLGAALVIIGTIAIALSLGLFRASPQPGLSSVASAKVAAVKEQRMDVPHYIKKAADCLRAANYPEALRLYRKALQITARGDILYSVLESAISSLDALSETSQAIGVALPINPDSFDTLSMRQYARVRDIPVSFVFLDDSISQMRPLPPEYRTTQYLTSFVDSLNVYLGQLSGGQFSLKLNQITSTTIDHKLASVCLEFPELLVPSRYVDDQTLSSLSRSIVKYYLMHFPDVLRTTAKGDGFIVLVSNYYDPDSPRDGFIVNPFTTLDGKIYFSGCMFTPFIATHEILHNLVSIEHHPGIGIMGKGEKGYLWLPPDWSRSAGWPVMDSAIEVEPCTRNQAVNDPRVDARNNMIKAFLDSLGTRAAGDSPCSAAVSAPDRSCTQDGEPLSRPDEVVILDELIGHFRQNLTLAAKVKRATKMDVSAALRKKGFRIIAERLLNADTCRAPPEFVALFKQLTGRTLRGFNFVDETGKTHIFTDGLSTTLAHEAGAISGLSHEDNRTLEKIILDTAESTEEAALVRAISSLPMDLSVVPCITDRARTAVAGLGAAISGLSLEQICARIDQTVKQAISGLRPFEEPKAEAQNRMAEAMAILGKNVKLAQSAGKSIGFLKAAAYILLNRMFAGKPFDGGIIQVEPSDPLTKEKAYEAIILAKLFGIKIGYLVGENDFAAAYFYDPEDPRANADGFVEKEKEEVYKEAQYIVVQGGRPVYDFEDEAINAISGDLRPQSGKKDGWMIFADEPQLLFTGPFNIAQPGSESMEEEVLLAVDLLVRRMPKKRWFFFPTYHKEKGSHSLYLRPLGKQWLISEARKEAALSPQIIATKDLVRRAENALIIHEFYAPDEEYIPDVKESGLTLINEETENPMEGLKLQLGMQAALAARHINDCMAQGRSPTMTIETEGNSLSSMSWRDFARQTHICAIDEKGERQPRFLVAGGTFDAEEMRDWFGTKTEEVPFAQLSIEEEGVYTIHQNEEQSWQANLREILTHYGQGPVLVLVCKVRQAKKMIGDLVAAGVAEGNIGKIFAGVARKDIDWAKRNAGSSRYSITIMTKLGSTGTDIKFAPAVKQNVLAVSTYCDESAYTMPQFVRRAVRDAEGRACFVAHWSLKDKVFAELAKNDDIENYFALQSKVRKQLSVSSSNDAVAKAVSAIQKFLAERKRLGAQEENRFSARMAKIWEEFIATRDIIANATFAKGLANEEEKEILAALAQSLTMKWAEISDYAQRVRHELSRNAAKSTLQQGILPQNIHAEW
ncbi:hypothetical protein D4Q80_03655, partial [bacterium]